MARATVWLCSFVLVLGSPAQAQVKKILTVGQPPEVVADWQSASNKVKIVNVTQDRVMQEIGDADAFVGVISPAQVQAGKQLKWVQITSAGVENVLHRSGSTALRDSGIVVTNNQIVQGPEIADHALAMLLYFSRRLNVYSADRLTENWRRGRFEGIELRGKNAVVIGLGGIGQQIAIRAWAFGMNVVGVDPEDIPMSPFWQKVVKPDQLDEVLPGADAVFISAPHTPLSHKMMGPAQFELMKKDSYFIAVSRGGLYDLPSLVKALDSGRLAGAGVDVTDPEPLPQGNSLWKFSNVIVTPHIAGRSDQDRSRMLGTVKENIKRFGEGKPLINVVDKQKGY
ncbi:MAG: D-2-hydroxyacid dehydrogenase [Bryobacterales bacterium]|nr:D-2-hydroxyacid dehydrogenase [Bryobacterales bacterium]